MVEKTDSKPNGLAIAAMILGICGFAILPIVFGAVQLSKIKKGEASGKGMAIAGLVIGIVRLVLAILITVLVCIIALPSLTLRQNDVMDTSRRSDYELIASAIQSYQTNNNGNLPSASSRDSFERTYLGGLYDPDTMLPYNVTIKENSQVRDYKSFSLRKGEVIIETGEGYGCNGGLMKSKRSYRLIGYVESGAYCTDSQR
ncbi:DUF4190 domain-containing protein [Candidatus Saccharibacteria bacterium]|nr:DUF4190 domain-containing protein [Candidatus Saccharibacteria bacterium]